MEELGGGLIAGEMAARPDSPSQLGVQGLYGVRCVDDPTYIAREGEEWDDFLVLSKWTTQVWTIVAGKTAAISAGAGRVVIRPAGVAGRAGSPALRYVPVRR